MELQFAENAKIGVLNLKGVGEHGYDKGQFFMSRQRDLQYKFLRRVAEMEPVIDDLKSAGPCPFDRCNALKNVEERLTALPEPCDVRRITSVDGDG